MVIKMNYNVKLSDEVREALALGRPVIALESTIIAHGMPYPQNVKTALACERLARTHGAVPATIAIIGGQLCAGAKSVLDIGLTLEYLETQGVPVVGFRTNKMPAFYTRDSGYNTPCRCDSVEELSDMVGAMANIPMRSGMVIVNPIPKEFEADEDMIDRATTKALREAEKNGITGRDVTPFLLARIAELTEGASLKANIALVYNNVRLAASVAAGVIQPD